MATILVPQGMAYAELAGLPAVTGLYTTIVCIVAYALLGTSRIMVLGPDSSVSPLIFAAIIPLLAGGGPERAIALAGILALLVGAIEIMLGLAKFGFIANLLSKEVQVGYMNGLGLTIILSQLPKFFGFSTDADGFIAKVGAFVSGLGQTNLSTLLLGLGALAILLTLPLFMKKIPAVLVAIVAPTIAVVALGLVESGVVVVGVLPQGLPTPSVTWMGLDDLGTLFVAALGIVLVSLTDTLAVATSFATHRGDEVNPNREMIALGAANAASALFQGFAVSASASRTAVASQSGAKTQVTGLVGAGFVVVLVVLLPGLVRNVPQAALAAVVIIAALGIIDVKTLVTYARVRKSALLVSVVGTFGVVIFGVLEGILIAIVLSILVFFSRNWWPPGKVLGRNPRTGRWQDIVRHPDAEQFPGIVVYRWEAQLFFANAPQFQQQVRDLLEARPELRWIVFQCEAITDIDVTAAGILKKLDSECEARGVDLAFVELRGRLKDLLESYGLLKTLTPEHFYYTIDEAIEGIRNEDGSPGDAEPHGDA